MNRVKVGRRGFLRGSLAFAAGRGELTLANARVALGFDRTSGAIAWFENQEAGRRHELPLEAIAPVRIWAGTPEDPDRHVITISRRHPRPFRHRVEGGALVMEFDNLPAGLRLVQTYHLERGEDFVRVRTAVSNRGESWVTGLYLGLEGLALSSDPKLERLTPADVYGRSLADPRHSLPAGRAFVEYPAGKRSFSIPPTVPTSLLVSWLDVSDTTWGVGTGYLNRQDLDMVGEVRAEAGGMALGWRLFRLEGTRGFMWGFNGPRQIYPLAPGEDFTSDEWILVFHAGDWHRTADAYRRRYEVAFRGDFLDWAGTSAVVRWNDIVLNDRVAWGNPSTDRKRPYDYPRGRVIHRFDEIAPLARKAIDALEVRAENVIVTVLGTAPVWGIYHMPDHFPMVEEAGGQAAAERMARDLKAMGVAGIIAYAHPFFMHRKARNYIAEADSGLYYPHQDWAECMGGIACAASRKWQELWAREIFPRYAAMGIQGLYFDEGFGHQFICTRADHAHGPKAAEVLSAQSRGALELYRTFRRMGGFLSCESGSDQQARLIDLWHFTPTETLRYTHPDRVMMAPVRRKDPAGSVALGWLLGCPLILMPFPEKPQEGEPLEGELLAALRRFVKLRRELRDQRAPGYPQGFRDTTGLRVSGGELRAKVYRASQGATVVYYAEKPFEGEVAVNGVTRKVKAGEKEMGYFLAR